MDSGISEIFHFGIRNTGLWNPEYGSRNPEFYYKMIKIQNPSSTAMTRIHASTWNPESKTVLDSLSWGDLVKISLNLKHRQMQLLQN